MAAVSDHATPQPGVEEAISALTRADWLRLREISLRLAYRNEALADDVFQESMARILAGDRPLQTDIKFVAFVAMVMKSIAWEFRERHTKDANAHATLESDMPDGVEITSIGQDDETDHRSLIERDIIAKEIREEIENHFSGDDHALAIVMGRQDGIARAEIEELFEMTRTEYESASKRVWRYLSQREAE